MGLPAYRVRGLYYGILTLAISEALRATIEYSARTTVAVTVGTIPELSSMEGVFVYLCVFTLFYALSLAAGVNDILYTKRKRLKMFKLVTYTLIFVFTTLSAYTMYASSISFVQEVSTGVSYVKMLRFTYPVNLYLLAVITLYLSYLLIKRLISSPLGSTFIAIRENPTRSAVIGYDVFAHQLVAFFASGFFAGIAGGVYVACMPTVMPDVFAIDKTFIALTGAVMGGLGTFVGPAIGGMLAGFLRDYLSGVTPALMVIGLLSLQQLQLLPSFILGMLYIAVVLALPNGIYGMWLLKGWKLKRKIESLL
jgi:ABC-type branched-subunit amino acid transport system permease subunit